MSLLKRASRESNQRWRRRALVAAGVVVLQLGVWSAWRSMGAQPEGETSGAGVTWVATHERLSPMVLVRPEERRSTAAFAPDQPWVLHLWASWCVPCREELPAFIALADGSGVPLVAGSLDEAWPPVAHFFEGVVPPVVWRLSVGRELPWAPVLPETWLVRDHTVLARASGAQAWSREALNAWVNAATAERSGEGVGPSGAPTAPR